MPGPCPTGETVPNTYAPYSYITTAPCIFLRINSRSSILDIEIDDTRDEIDQHQKSNWCSFENFILRWYRSIVSKFLWFRVKTRNVAFYRLKTEDFYGNIIDETVSIDEREIIINEDEERKVVITFDDRILFLWIVWNYIVLGNSYRTKVSIYN